jgi:hypothetical protein
MGHILNPLTESSPLLVEEFAEPTPAPSLLPRTQDFWDQYFRFQELAEIIAERDARVNVDVVNNATGESFHFENVVLKTSGETSSN